MKWFHKRETRAGDTLFWLTGTDRFSVERAFQHVLVTGQTGSGKTLSAIDTIVEGALACDFAVVVVSVKATDPEFWEGVIRRAGKPVKVLAPGRDTFDVAKWEADTLPLDDIRAGYQNLLVKMGRAVGGGGGGDAYFPLKGGGVIAHLFAVAKHLGLDPSPAGLRSQLHECPLAPLSPEARRAWFAAPFGARVKAAMEGGHTPEFANAVEYFLIERPAQGEKHRASVDTYPLLLWGRLSASPAREVIAPPGGGTYTPEMTCRDGVSVVIGLPTLVYGEPAVNATAKILGCIAKAALRRKLGEQPRRVMLVIDEAQLVLTDECLTWVGTGRSQLLSVVAATQNVESLQAALGSGEAGKTAAEAVLANFSTRISLLNVSRATNDYHADSIGKVVLRRRSQSVSGGPLRLMPEDGERASVSCSWNEVVDYEVPPVTWAALAPGEAIVYSAGASYAGNGGRGWVKVRFPFGGK